MKTAEAIEGMTDAGAFEILAIRVLRITDGDCRALEHMGVNAAGKTISNPLDSFCKVPGTNPPRFISAAFTTEMLKSLERKWLFDHKFAPRSKKATSADDGDLVKAARRATILRNDHPKATFVLHLCTNRQPDDQLMAKAYKRGEELGVEVRFLARSRLRDVLDMDPDGQWLRKEHLGIQAERPSLPLLRELSAKSLHQYEKEFLITPPETFVPTTSMRALAAALDSPRSIYVVTGASGSGKSAACFQVLRDHLAKDGIGFWIPGEIAARATSLEEVLRLTLQALHSTIESGAGADALRIRLPSQRLLLVVDDINQGGNPAEFLRKLVTWGCPVTDDKGRASAPSAAIVLPAWELHWAPLDEHLASAGWLAKVPVAKMSEAESLSCLDAALGGRSPQLTKADRQRAVATLGYDPILIAMYAVSVEDHGEFDPDLVHDVIGRFVMQAEAEATASGGQLQDEYDQALTHLAKRLLAERDLYPRWDLLQQWLPAANSQAISGLARLGKICRITRRGSENRFEFRHDRILEHFLVRAIEPMLDDLGSSNDVLSDPFYASFVGRALASVEPSDDLLDWIRKNAPLALISAIGFLAGSPGDAADRIAAAAQSWLSSASEDGKPAPLVLVLACRRLQGMNSPHVLTVTQSLARHPLAARARLANGDTAAGVVEFSDTRWFAPAVNDRELDAVLGRALHSHRQGLITKCAEMLHKHDLPEGERRGALVLAGFIGDAALAAPVQSAWDLTAERANTLLPALWAGIRCAAIEPAAVLDDMITMWASLSDEREGSGISERGVLDQELQFALRRGVPEPVLRYLMGKARSEEALRGSIRFTLEHLDHPIVVRFLVEEAAEIERQVKESGGFSPWVMDLRHKWDPTYEPHGMRLSPDSVQVIRSCWESGTADPQLRENAFECWISAIDDPQLLRSISADHPQLSSVLWRRAQLGDFSAIPLIKPLVAGDNHWFRIIANVWTQEFRDVLDDALLSLEQHTPTDFTGGATDQHYALANLLRDIPPGDAEPLLLKHWKHLRFSMLFVQAALYLGTPECREVADAAIREWPTNFDPFEHIAMFFGFKTYGLVDRLDWYHLEVLVPYKNRLGDIALSDMAEFCERRGRPDWGRLNLKPEFDRRRALLPEVAREDQTFIERLGRHHYPSAADLLEELDWIELQGKNYDGHLYYWCKEFARRQDDHSRWQRLLDEWLSRKPTVERFRVLASAILEHGTREDLVLLRKHALSGDVGELDRLRANAELGVTRRSLR